MNTDRIALRMLTIALAAAAFTTYQAQAQETVEPDATSPPAAVGEPQYSSITSTNNVVQLSRVPVTYNGKIYYEDVTLTMVFTVDTAVNPNTVSATVKPTVVASPVLVVNNFKAGTYVGPADINGGKSIIVVTGPSPLSGGGTGWSLSITSAASTATYPSNAVWYVESIANNPLAARIKAAGITSTQLSFGEGDSGSSPDYNWDNNSLLGFNQVGNTLVISCFTNNGQDRSTPSDTITYTLQP